MRSDTRSLTVGLALGAGLMYLLDPSRGARRRNLLRDKMVHARRVAREGWDATSHGAAVAHTGVIRLVPLDDATRVELRMSYNPPAGVLGHVVAASFGRDPKRQMDDDLARLKTTIETGHAPRDAARQLAETAGSAAVPD